MVINDSIIKFLQKNFVVILFFSLFLISGIIIAKDYGIAFDEDIQRVFAQNRLDYITNYFSNLFQEDIRQKKEVIFFQKEYGVVFELPVLLLEKFFGYTSIRDQYIFRHLSIFIFSFFGSIFFYFLSLKRFNSWKLALLSTILLVSTPRIFAQSFYNSKDIVFMYFFLINTFFALNFINKPTNINAFLFALVSSLCIGVRSLGILLPVFIFYFLWIKFLRNDYKIKLKSPILIFLSSLIILTIFFWPTLWENPIKSFFHSLMSFKSYDQYVFNFYLGEFVFAHSNYWHYIPVWILITTPPLIVIIFIYGFCVTLFRVCKRLIKIDSDNDSFDLWRGQYEFQDLLFLSLIIVPIFLTIVIKATLYNGWRHLFFIYPFIILVGINGLRVFYLYLKMNNLKIITKIVPLIISFLIIFNFFWLFKNHPFQNNYFNIFAGSDPHKNFEVDYWGLSNRYALEKIINSDSKEIITVSSISFTPLIQNFNILTNEQRKRLKYTGKIKESDYLINNNIFYGANKHRLLKIPNNFTIYDQLFVDDILITTIYKRNN